MNLVLDYSDYVEMLCQESDGAYRLEPSLHDVTRNALRFQTALAQSSRTPLSPSRGSIREMTALAAYQDWRLSVFGTWRYINMCPYCNHALTSKVLPATLPRFVSTSLRYCLNCGWWDTEEDCHVEYPDPADPKHYVAQTVHRRAVLREFDVAGSDVPVMALRQHLITHPTALHQLNPHRLERLVESIFRDFMSCEAVHIGGPGDGGVDLILVHGPRRYVVQVKRRQSASKAESVKSVREFIGAMVISGETRGIFVSTAPAFSRQAVRDAEVVQARGAVEYLELMNGTRLLEICEIASGQASPSWQCALTAEKDLLEHINTGRFEFLELVFGPKNGG